MEEPYRTIQEIGQAAERLASDTTTPAEEKFAAAQKWIHQLADIKFRNKTIPVEWEQYIAGVDTSLHQILAEVRPKVNRHHAAQISIESRTDLGWEKMEAEQERRQKKYERREKFKVGIRTGLAIGLITFILVEIFVYQWLVLSSNEGWFHDISKKRWQVIEKRMNFGKSIETKDHNGMTGLLYLARTGSLDDIQALHRMGADIHATDNTGKTALHHAAANANRLAIEWLIAEGLDVNKADNSGTTPLHYFFSKSSWDEVRPPVLRFTVKPRSKN